MLCSHHSTLLKIEDDATRDQSFFTGFAHQVFRLQELPEELASWMIDQSELITLFPHLY